MRILALNYEYPPTGGGGGIGFKYLVQQWAQKGHQVDVLTSNTNLSYHLDKNKNLNLHRLPVFPQKKYTTSFFTMLSYLLAATFFGIFKIFCSRYDIINSHFALPTGPAGFVLSKLSQTPHVLTIIGGDIYDPTKKSSPHKSFLLRLIIKNIARNAQQVISISSDIKEKAQNYYQMKEITIIPYGLKTPNIELKSKTNSASPTCKLITIGRMVKRKGFSYLLKALALNKNRNVQLHLIGEGPLKKQLIKLANKLKIQNKVTFEGTVSEKKKHILLKESDIYVLPSLHEGLGLVIQEAMAFALAVIATNNGGQTDLVSDGENGLLVPPADVQSLTNALNKLIENPDLRNKMARNNKRQADKYEVEKLAERYLDIFRRINNNE
jgi:glycosyltransferase involved in cell wall biosynthesis